MKATDTPPILVFLSKGDDYTRKGSDCKTFGIDVEYEKTVLGKKNVFTHYNQIEVYGNEELRDAIIQVFDAFRSITNALERKE